MFETWTLSLMLNCLLAAFVLLVRVQQGSWVSPGTFFPLFWCAFVFIALILFPENYVHPAAIVWIIISAFVVYVGTICGSGRMLSKGVPAPLKGYLAECLITDVRLRKLAWLRGLTIVCSILGFGSSIVIIISTGRSISVFFDFDTFMQMGRELSVARYSDPSYRESDLAVVLFAFIYTAGLFGGTLLAFAKSKFDRIISFAPIISAVSTTLVCTTRATLLMTLVYLVSSYFSASVYATKGRLRYSTAQSVCTVLFIALLVVIVLIVALISRHSEADLGIQTIAELLRRTGVAVFGSLASFSYWFPDNWQLYVPPGLGRHTLGGPLSLIGLEGRLDHITSEYGNVYTVFRDLSHDFTLPGSLIVLWFIGFLGGMSFERVLRGRLRYLPILVTFYGFTLRSFSGGLFRYSTMLVALLLYGFYIVIVCERKSSRQLVGGMDALPHR